MELDHSTHSTGALSSPHQTVRHRWQTEDGGFFFVDVFKTQLFSLQMVSSLPRSEWYPQPQCPLVRVNSVIISAVVVSSNQMVNTSMLSEPIIITLQHENTSLTRPMCAFLNEREVQMEG